MIVLNKPEECCGCHGCSNICPKHCIVMKADVEGFKYPSIDTTTCIECGLCEKVCPVLEEVKMPISRTSAYAIQVKSDETRKASSSGGVFSEISRSVIQQGGVVFGARFGESLKVKHAYAEDMEGVKSFQGSKYVQSEIGSTYQEAKKFLLKGRKVLFTGTQCQIKGLNLYLNKQYNNLITAEVICHGVPSPMVLKKYQEELEQKYGKKIIDIKFRNKDISWENFQIQITFNDGTSYTEKKDNDPYMLGFLKNYFLRPSCYDCKAKKLKSGADITLGDYWGLAGIHKNIKDELGTSLVVANTPKGDLVLKEIQNHFKQIIPTSLKYAILHNSAFVSGVDRNPNREVFFEDYAKESSLNGVIKKYIISDNVDINSYSKKMKGIYKRVKSKFYKLLYKYLKI